MVHNYNPYSKIFLELGPFNITWYAFFIGLGVVIAYLIAVKYCDKFGIKKSDLQDGLTYCFILSVLGARLYYCLFYNPSYYFTHPIELISIWDGGLAIHGGLITAIIFIYFFTKKRNINLFAALELVAPSMLIAQASGRFGNFMNQEAHGPVINANPDLGRAFLEDTLHLPDFITNQMYLYGESGLNYYHPTFLYEALPNIIMALLILFVFRKMKFYKMGDACGIYLIWYGFLRYLIEILRTDALMLFGVIKVAQLVSIAMIILGVAFLIYQHKFRKDGYYLDFIKGETDCGN